jgi:AraC-like DNA-binding protein
MAKASLIRIKYSLATTIDVSNEEIPYFYNPLHYHPEVELTLVEQSSGIRIVGNSMEHFGPRDLVMVGANTPHIWKNEQQYDSNGQKINAKAVVIKFLPDFAGTSIFDLNEMLHIKRLLFENSLYGIKIEGKLHSVIEKQMKMLVKESPSARIISLLKILNTIAESNEFRLLSKNLVAINEQREKKLNIVISFLQANYKNQVELDEIATIACMNKNSLCQYFKQKTGKTIFGLLHEIRLKRACELLVNSNDSVESISSTVGYFSQTLFNRKFKELYKTPPTAYRKLWSAVTPNYQ